MRVFIYIILFLAMFQLTHAQSDGTLPPADGGDSKANPPVETPAITEISQPADSAPRVTQSALPKPSPTPRTEPAVSSAAPLPSPDVSDSDGLTEDTPQSNSFMIILGGVVSILALFGLFKLTKGEKKDKKETKCFNIKKLLDDKIRELTDLRGQLESKAQGIAREKLKETIKDTPVLKLLEATERAEAEVERLKKLFKECIIEFDYMKPVLYIVCGVGFSGKSTLAKNITDRLKSVIVSQDSVYFEKREQLNLNQDSDEDWEKVRELCRQRIKEQLTAGNSVVFDDVNLSKQNRGVLKKIAEDAGGRAIVIFLDTPEDVLAKRQAQNKISADRHEVKQEYLDEAKSELEKPDNEENAYVFKPETDIDDFIKHLK